MKRFELPPSLRTISQAAESLHATIPNISKEAIPEITVYFKESWGNRQRIDYGSGMELNFLCWMYVAFLCRRPPIDLCQDMP